MSEACSDFTIILVSFLERSYAGVDNDVIYMDQTMMLLADAEKMVGEINRALDH